jgi:uncharacterized protein YcfJ
MPTIRLNQISGFILGATIGGIIGTYYTRYFGLLLVLGAALGLLLGQWSRNHQEEDVTWLRR